MLPTDLMTGKNCNINYKSCEYEGLSETILDSTETITKVIKQLEKMRRTDKTNKNCTSSRTFAIMELRHYRVEGDKAYENTFRIVDFAGAERHEVSGFDGGPTMKTTGHTDISIATFVNNYSLL